MKFAPVLLPDHYSEGKRAEFSVYHFTTDAPFVRHNILLKQNLICILLGGSKEVFGSHTSVRIGNRELLLMSTGSSIMMHSETADNARLESILFFFSDNILREFCLKHKLDFSGRPPKSVPVLSIPKDEFLLNFENSLKFLEGDNYTSLQRLKLEELLVYLALSNPSENFKAFVQNALCNSGRDQKLRNVVAGNIANGLSVEELAFLCDMSASTFKRHFIKTFHCTPKKYLTDKKMERAQVLLRLDRNPSEIFPALHYKSLSAFSTEFKKHVGVSPKQFLKDMAVAD